MDALSRDEARRMAVAAQGFADPRPALAGKDQFGRVVDRIGLLQIDSVNVVERAHYFPLYSRLGPYEQGLLDEYVYRDRRMFEGWAHVASLLPVEHYPLVRHRMEAARETNRWFINGTTPEYIERVLEEVRERGPIVAGGLDDPGQRTGPWWGYGKGKIALEWHFRAGSLAIRERRNFARVYDLPERVFDAAVLEAPAVPRDVAEREMLRMAARAHGVGTARDLADYYRIKVPEAKKRLVELVDAGELERVRVEGWKEPGYIVAGAAPPAEVRARALVCPFDPLVWERARTERLFDFFYRIEIYTPAPKRVYGYYVLPFLLDTELVARVDVKADRQKGALLVRGSYLEEGKDEARVAAELSGELDELARWLGLGKVQVGARGNLARALRRARR